MPSPAFGLYACRLGSFFLSVFLNTWTCRGVYLDCWWVWQNNHYALKGQNNHYTRTPCSNPVHPSLHTLGMFIAQHTCHQPTYLPIDPPHHPTQPTTGCTHLDGDLRANVEGEQVAGARHTAQGEHGLHVNGARQVPVAARHLQGQWKQQHPWWRVVLVGRGCGRQSLRVAARQAHGGPTTAARNEPTCTCMHTIETPYLWCSLTHAGVTLHTHTHVTSHFLHLCHACHQPHSPPHPSSSPPLLSLPLCY